MRQDGNGAQKVGRTLTLGNQKSQEHAQDRCAPFGRSPAGAGTLFQYKLAQGVGIQFARDFTKASKQLDLAKDYEE